MSKPIIVLLILILYSCATNPTIPAPPPVTLETFSCNGINNDLSSCRQQAQEKCLEDFNILEEKEIPVCVIQATNEPVTTVCRRVIVECQRKLPMTSQVTRPGLIDLL